MKKTYMAPRMEQMTIGNELPLCTSGVRGGGGIDLDYGGVDLGGTYEPAAKERLDFGDW